MNVLLRHCATICIVSLGIPKRCIAIAAPDGIEWVHILSALRPSRSSPANFVAPLRCPRIIFDEDMMFCGSSAFVVAKAFIVTVGRAVRS